VRVGVVGGVVVTDVAPSRTRNHRRDQCFVSGGAISNVHAPANESAPIIDTATSRTAALMSARE
jgi:hypothetical protein